VHYIPISKCPIYAKILPINQEDFEMTGSSGIQNFGTVSPSSQFTPFDFSTLSSLVKKTDWVFGLLIVAPFVGVFSYTVWKGCQYLFHNTSNIDKDLKSSHRKILLDQVGSLLNNDPTSAEIKPLLQQCEALEASISKERSVELIGFYATVDADHAYELAKGLTSCSDLFNAAKAIQKAKPEFNRRSLTSLCRKSLQALKTSESTHEHVILSEIRLALKLAEEFQSLKADHQLMIESLELALTTFQRKGMQPWLQVKALGEIAEVCIKEDKLGDYVDLISKALSTAGLPHGHLAWAQQLQSNSIFDDPRTEKELEKYRNSFNNLSIYVKTKVCVELADIFKKIPSTDNSTVKDIATEAINATFEELQKTLSLLPINERAEAYLNMASAYHKLDLLEKGNSSIRSAIGQIKTLPDVTDEQIETKQDLLKKITDFYEKAFRQAEEALGLLEALYDNIPSLDFDLFNKREIAIRIIQICNQMGMAVWSTRFFNKYLLDIKDQIKNVRKKFNHLIPHTNFLPEQQKKMLETAEALVYPLGEARTVSRIANAYLSFDREKSREILKNFETRSAKSHFAIATVAAIALGALYFYPQSYRFLSTGAIGLGIAVKKN
jgi:tetratricopeptide (TPR) repeat protein